jgi:hypothetical protein
MPPRPKSKKTGVRAAATADQATMVVTLYDGTRQPIQGNDFLIRILDGFQNQLVDKSGPRRRLSLNCHFATIFRTIASSSPRARATLTPASVR